MSTSHIGRRVREIILREKSQLSTDIAAGIAVDLAQYKYLCGIIEGYSRCENFIDDAEKED